MTDRERRYKTIFIDSDGEEIEGSVCVRLGDDGIIIDMEDEDGEIIATNGLDIEFLTDMCE